MILIQNRNSFVTAPLVLWALSFLCSLYFFNDWQYPMFAASSVFLYAWAYLSLSRRLETGWVVPKSPVLLFAGLFWLLVFSSVFWSDVKPASLMGFALFSAMPLTFIIATLFTDEGFFKKLAPLLAVIFAGLSLWAMFQFFFLNAYFFGQARHPLGDPSSLGSLFSLALFCALGWLLSDRPKREHRCAVALSMLLVCGIIATVARGPVFAFIPGAVLLSVLFRPQIKANAKSLVIVVLGGLLFYGLTLTGIQKHYDLGTRLFGTLALQGDISNNRIEVWSSTWEMIKHHPWTGTGIGTFYLHYPQYRHVTDVDGAYLAHNDPLQFWAELGVLGPLFFYAFAAAASFRTFQALKIFKDEGDMESRLIVGSLFAGLAAMAVGSHVGFNHYNLCILMMNGLMLAAWFAVSGKAFKHQAKIACLPKSPPALSRVLIALPFVMILWMVLGIVAGEYYASRARDNIFAGQMNCVEMGPNSVGVTKDCFPENINRADRVSHGLNYRAFIFAVNVPMSVLEYKKGQLSNAEASELYEQVTYYMGRALAINPHAGDAYYYLAKVQTLVPPKIVPAATPSVEDYYKKALVQDPMLLGARLELYKMYKEQKRPAEECLAVLEPGLYFFYATPLASQYYGVLGQAYAAVRDYGKMQEVAQLNYNFSRRSEFSKVRLETSIPQAIMGGESRLPAFR